MAFHTCVYFQTDTLTSTLADIPAVTDGWATVQNNHFIFQQDYKMWACWPFANTITRARISAPHYRFVNTPEIVPVQTVQADVQGLTFPVMEPPYLIIPRIDEIQAIVSTSGTSSTGITVALWVGDGNKNIAQGDRYPCRFTGTTTSATGAWVRTNITFTETLPAGEYEVQGMDVVGSGYLLARLRFQDYLMLPGCIVRPDLNDTIRDVWRNGKFGSWGRFKQTAQPSIELFSNSTGGAGFTGTMDLVRVSSAT